MAVAVAVAGCVVSALNGVRAVMIGRQGALFDAAVRGRRAALHPVGLRGPSKAGLTQAYDRDDADRDDG